MKTQVYSWRLSEELKSDLEREARLRNVSVSEVLETAVRDLIQKDDTRLSDNAIQLRLHQGVAPCLGTVRSGNPNRAESARQTLRRRLRKRYAR